MVVRSEEAEGVHVLSPNDKCSLDHKIPAAENALSASMNFTGMVIK